ncbi:MAG: O-antigen ligase family protein [Candidatus Paceibacterota bacterium]
MKKEAILRWIIYVGAGLLTLTPLIVASSMYFPFITGKAFYFRTIVMIIFGAWAILALYDRRVRPQWSPVAWALAALLGVGLVASLLGINPGDSIWSNFERMMGWITLLHLALLFVPLAHTLQAKHWRWLFYLSLGVSVIIAMIGFGQIPDPKKPRIDATLGNPIYLAAYAVVHAFIAGFFKLRRLRLRLAAGKSFWLDWYPYIFGIIAVLNLAVLYYTRGRGAMLGMLAGLGIALLLVAIFERRHIWVRRIAIGAVILAVVGGGLFLANRDADFIQSNDVLASFANISFDEGTAGARLDVWSVALNGYMHSPKTMLIGWGPGNFNYVFNTYYHPELFAQETWFDRAHNVAIEWLVAAGPAGFLSYLALFVTAIYLIWRKEKGEKNKEEFGVLEKSLLTGLVVAYLVQNLFVFDHLVSYWMLAMILAWVHGRSIHHESPGMLATVKGWFTSRDEWLSDEARAWVGTGVAIGAAILIWTINYPGHSQATTLIEALTHERNQPEQALVYYEEAIAYDAMGTQEARERLTNAAMKMADDHGTTSDIAQSYFQLASEELEAQIAAEPEDLRHLTFYGDLLLSFGQPEAAVEQFAQADQMGGGQKQVVIFQLARAQAAAGDSQAALDSYERAYQLDTSFEEPALRYAAALIQAGESDEADAVLEETFGTAAVSSNFLIQAYINTEQFDKLIPIFEERLQNNQGDIQAYVNLVAVLLQAGQMNEARQVAEQAAEIFPELDGRADELIEQLQENNPLDQ